MEIEESYWEPEGDGPDWTRWIRRPTGLKLTVAPKDQWASPDTAEVHRPRAARRVTRSPPPVTECQTPIYTMSRNIM